MNSPSFQSYNILGGNLNYPISNKCRRPAKSAGILNTIDTLYLCVHQSRKLRNGHILLRNTLQKKAKLSRKCAIFFDLPNRHRVTN